MEAQAHQTRTAPRCQDCRHSRPAGGIALHPNATLMCNHPATPVSALSGRPLLRAVVMRGAPAYLDSERVALVSLGLGGRCGRSGELFSARPATAEILGQPGSAAIGAAWLKHQMSVA